MAVIELTIAELEAVLIAVDVSLEAVSYGAQHEAAKSAYEKLREAADAAGFRWSVS